MLPGPCSLVPVRRCTSAQTHLRIGRAHRRQHCWLAVHSSPAPMRAGVGRANNLSQHEGFARSPRQPARWRACPREGRQSGAQLGGCKCGAGARAGPRTSRISAAPVPLLTQASHAVKMLPKARSASLTAQLRQGVECAQVPRRLGARWVASGLVPSARQGRPQRHAAMGQRSGKCQARVSSERMCPHACECGPLRFQARTHAFVQTAESEPGANWW